MVWMSETWPRAYVHTYEATVAIYFVYGKQPRSNSYEKIALQVKLLFVAGMQQLRVRYKYSYPVLLLLMAFGATKF